MKLTNLITILISFLLYSCSESNTINTIVDFDKAMLDTSKDTKNSWILIGDHDIVDLPTQNRMKQIMSTYRDIYNFYFCDISNNEHINYIYKLQALPTAILVSPENNILYISNKSNDELFDEIDDICNLVIENGKPILANVNFDSAGEPLAELYFRTYKAYQALDSLSQESLSVGFENIQKSIAIESDFYNNYLGHKLAVKLQNDSLANHYKKEAVHFFENQNTPLYTALFLDLTKKDSDNTAIIELEPMIVDFGTIPADDSKTMSVKISNTGTSPLVLLNITLSCSCMDLKWDKKPIPAGSESYLQITYNADKNKGEANKSIYVMSNASNGNKTLSIKASIN